MQHLIILHSNDIHGRIDGLGRIATLVAQVRAENPAALVLYLDIGDCEESSVRLSNLTKGVAMHQLLDAAGCDAVAVGNGALPRYGPPVLADQAAATRYPHLLANLCTASGDQLPGTQPSVLRDLGAFRLGLIGLAPDIRRVYEQVFGLRLLPAEAVIREQIAALRAAGADAVIVMSHLGLPGDRELAAALDGAVPLILGGHSHDLLPEGEWAGSTLIAQARMFAEYLGRVDLTWDGAALRVDRASTQPVTDAIPVAGAFQAARARLEAELERYLAEIIGEIAEPLDYSTERECAAANLMADALRERMGAEVGVVIAGHTMQDGLPAGPLSRLTLWDRCNSAANPAAIRLTGAQLTELIRRGLDPERAAEQPNAFRGQPRGLIHLSGATVRGGVVWIGESPLDPERVYRVAGSDVEFEPEWGYVDAEWNATPEYELPTILREALADYLAAHRPVRVDGPRVLGTV